MYVEWATTHIVEEFHDVMLCLQSIRVNTNQFRTNSRKVVTGISKVLLQLNKISRCRLGVQLGTTVSHLRWVARIR